MRQGFFKTNNLVACLQRLQNQYNIVGVIDGTPVDWNLIATEGEAKDTYRQMWPRCVEGSFGTKLEQDQQTGEYHFNLLLTQAQVDSLPTEDTPNFTFQYEGELTDPQDPESPPLPLPTFKVELHDDFGVPTGVFNDRTVCIQR